MNILYQVKLWFFLLSYRFANDYLEQLIETYDGLANNDYKRRSQYRHKLRKAAVRVNRFIVKSTHLTNVPSGFIKDLRDLTTESYKLISNAVCYSDR